MAEKNYRTVAVIPEMPRTIDEQQLYVYVPQGTTSNFGVFKPDGQQFVITADGILRVDASKLIQLATPSAQVVEDGGETSVEVQFTETDHTLLRQFQFIFQNIKGATGQTGADALNYREFAMRYNAVPTVGHTFTVGVSSFNRTPKVGESFNVNVVLISTNDLYFCQANVTSLQSSTITATFQEVTKVTGTKGDTGEDALVYSDTYTESVAGDVADEPIQLELANFSRTPVVDDTFILTYYTTETGKVSIALFTVTEVTDSVVKAQLVFGTQYVITGPQGEQGIQGETGTPGEDGVGITSVTQTGVQGGTQVTITLSNGQSTSFTVYDGINTNFQVVDELPTENISTSTIYLISAGYVEEDNIYDEYIYVSGNWEHIGSTSVDLDAYVTKTFFNQNVGDATKNYIVAQLAKVHNLYIEMYESGSVPVVEQALTLTNANFARVPVANQYFGLLEVVNTKDKYYSVCQILSVDTTTCSAKVIAVTEVTNGTEIDDIKASIAALTTTVNGKADASALSGKLDKVTASTTMQQVYVKNADGTQDMVNVDFEETGRSIVRRRMNGTIDCNGGTGDKQAATVGQMNEAIAAAQPYHIELTGYTGTVTQEQYNKLKADDKSYIYFTNDQVTAARVLSGDTGLYYNAATGVAQYRLFIRAALTYTMEVFNLEMQSNKKNAITGTGNDTDYPTTKAVVDYVAANSSKPYSVAINATSDASGQLTQEQVTSLINDDNSYIMVTEGNTVTRLSKSATTNNYLEYSKFTGPDNFVIQISKTTYAWAVVGETYQSTNQKTNSLSSSSTNDQYPSAKATYDNDQSTLTAAKAYADSILGAEQAWLQKITTGEGV